MLRALKTGMFSVMVIRYIEELELVLLHKVVRGCPQRFYFRGMISLGGTYILEKVRFNTCLIMIYSELFHID